MVGGLQHSDMGITSWPCTVCHFLSATWVESMLIPFSAATKWGGIANSIDDRTKTPWDHRAGTVDGTLENGMLQKGEEEVSTLGANGKVHVYRDRRGSWLESREKRSGCFYPSPRQLWMFGMMRTLKFKNQNVYVMGSDSSTSLYIRVLLEYCV